MTDGEDAKLQVGQEKVYISCEGYTTKAEEKEEEADFPARHHAAVRHVYLIHALEMGLLMITTWLAWTTPSVFIMLQSSTLILASSIVLTILTWVIFGCFFERNHCCCDRSPCCCPRDDSKGTVKGISSLLRWFLYMGLQSLLWASVTCYWETTVVLQAMVTTQVVCIGWAIDSYCLWQRTTALRLKVHTWVHVALCMGAMLALLPWEMATSSLWAAGVSLVYTFYLVHATLVLLDMHHVHHPWTVALLTLVDVFTVLGDQKNHSYVPLRSTHDPPPLGGFDLHYYH